VTIFRSRLGAAAKSLPRVLLCDSWLADGQRFGDERANEEIQQVLGCWPDALETDAMVRLAHVLGEQPSWEDLAMTPPVAQKLAERARPQPLDQEIAHHLQHLEHVCHRPRLDLRVEEERLPVSRARRTPLRAVADLVSHPGDWEHRTFRSIQPARILARQMDDEWNLYENRVAVRLVDHLLAYLAQRLEELRRIQVILEGSRDHSEQLRRTSFRRAHRVSELWSESLESGTEDELTATLQRLELAQRSLQGLLDTQLYQRVPRRQTVALALSPTNILVNDPHYRKVAALWRAWAKHGHKRQETRQQRAERKRQEAATWDRFVLHLLVRAFDGLGWNAEEVERGAWRLTHPGWLPVLLRVDAQGVFSLETHSVARLRLLPLCANLATANGEALACELGALDKLEGEIVVVHVGGPAAIWDLDRATGLCFGGRAVLFACSPWGIDSEERMGRLLHGWLSRAAAREYPLVRRVQELPALPAPWGWLRYEDPHLVVLRAPDPGEIGDARSWGASKAKELERKAQQAKLARQASPVAPQRAVRDFLQLLDEVGSLLEGLGLCPVCGTRGAVEPRIGKRKDGADATWWARCNSCDTEWGLRPCTSCSARYRALSAQCGIDLAVLAEETAPRDWPDKALGREVWAMPCRAGREGQFRCPACGACSDSGCTKCRA